LLQRAQQRLEAGLQALDGQAVDWTLPSAPRCWEDWAQTVDRLAVSAVASYRQLPRLLYQFHWEADEAGRALALDAGVVCVFGEATAWAARLAALVDAWLSHEHVGEGTSASWLMDAAQGEPRRVVCTDCGWQGDRDRVRAGWKRATEENLLPLEEVATPACATIAELAAYLEIPAARTAKAVFRIATTASGEELLVFAITRGDTDLNEAKLARALDARHLRPATEEEIRAVGAVPGYASPVGIDHPRVRVVVDELVAVSPNLVAGANREGYHLRNVNLGRDYRADLVTDIADPGPGAPCPACGAPLEAHPALAVAALHQLDAPQATYLDERGKACPVAVVGLHLHLDSWLIWLAERHHDEHGLVWPVAWAPFDLHLVSLRGGEEPAEAIYHQAQERGLRVLWDDRDASPGVKFTDADLIGIPWRATVSKRSLAAGGVELKRREGDDRVVVSIEQMWALLKA